MVIYTRYNNKVIYTKRYVVVCYVQWVGVRGDCSLCCYWWNCWSSLFNLSFNNWSYQYQNDTPLFDSHNCRFIFELLMVIFIPGSIIIFLLITDLINIKMIHPFLILIIVDLFLNSWWWFLFQVLSKEKANSNLLFYFSIWH